MIIGGLQTGNTPWLAAHLQNAADNESVQIAEVTGTVATDIDGALAEFDAYALGTRASEGVYAAFINPPEPLSREQYMRAIYVIEQRLGLDGQPRIILFHVKPDKSGSPREHCHIVWSRIDTRRMKAIPLSHDRQKLRRCAKDLAAEFGLELPPNLANDRGNARFDDPPQPTRAEKAMEARSGLSREERRALITQCYRLADSAQAFMNSLEAAGFMLARGDKRCYVVVDMAGDVHALARQIDGAKTKDVKKKLEGVTLSLLPPVEKARILMLRRAAAVEDALRSHRKKTKRDEAARERLLEIQRNRRRTIDLLWQQMKIRHMHERKVLLAHIKAKEILRLARRHWLAAGLALYLRKIAVIRQLIEYYEKRKRLAADEQNRLLMAALQRRHDNEAAELARRYKALGRLERREAQTLAPPAIIGASSVAPAETTSFRTIRVKIPVSVTPQQFAVTFGKPIDVTAAVSFDRMTRFQTNAADITFAAAGAPPVILTLVSNTSPFPLAHDPSSWPFRVNAFDITHAVAFTGLRRDETRSSIVSTAPWPSGRTASAGA